MKKFLSILIVILPLITTQISYSQIATNDPTFNPTDIGFGNGDGPNNLVYATSVLSDGKILVAGSFNYYNQKSQGRIMRLNPDGSLDPSFLTGTGFNADVYTMVVQPDGKIIVGGGFGLFNGQLINRIARLNADGTLDATFNPGSGANNLVKGMALQSDGKIIISGNFNSYNGVDRNYIARINTDGSLDASFNTGTGADFFVYNLALQSDGKIIIGGNFSNVNGNPRKNIARLNSDGSLDNSFVVGSGADKPVSVIRVQSDNQILIGGNFTLYNGAAAQGICRLNTDGTRDASFTIATQEVLSITIQSDNKILIGGNFNTINSSMSYASLARLNTDGSVDNTFNPIPASTILSITVQSDGQLILGGTFPSYGGLWRSRLFRLHSDGVQDLTFNPCTGADHLIIAVTVLPDDKILIGGAFNYYNGKPRNHIARLNADGTLDETFNPGTGTDGYVMTIVAQPDGKILIGGQFNYYNGATRRCITRLNADGSLDGTFNPTGFGINGIYVKSILLQNDGKIVIGGNFVNYNNSGTNALARLTSTGAYDPTFTNGLNNPNSVESIVMQSDGKFIIAGLFSSYSGVARNNVARINSNGSLDATFDPGSGIDKQVSSVVLQSDQKVILGGVFTSYNGTSVNNLVRINSDGSRDASFDAGVVNNSMSVVSLLLQADNKLLVTGYFTKYGSQTIGSFARLNTDGSLDVNFIANTGSENSTYALGLQSDGKIILGGAFAGFNSTGRNRITRLLTTPCTPPTITSTTPSSSCGNGSVTLSASASAGTVKWYSSANGGEPFTTGNSYKTPVLTSSETYYVETIVGGCPSGRTAIIATVNNPKIGTTINGNLCDAGSVVLTANGSTGSTINWYDASIGGTLLGTGSTFTTPVVTTITDYYAEASIGSCVVAPRRIVKAIVNYTPKLISSKSGSVCGSGTADLQAAFDLGATTRWYSASTGGTSIASGYYFTTPTISTPTSYYVDAISGGCLSGRIEIPVSVDAMPTVTGTIPGTRCGIGSVTLGATSDAGTINWYSSSVGGVSLGTGNSFSTPSIAFSKDYYVSAVKGACVSARTTVAATINSAIDISTTVTDNMITSNETGATYQWLNCLNGNSIIQNETNQSYTALSTGNYSVSVSKNGCKDTSACVDITINVNGVKSGDNENEIVIAPNPSNGIIKIQVKLPVDNISITTTAGEKIMNLTSNDNNIILDMRAYQNGMYFIHLKTNDKIQTEKFILLK